MSNRRSVSADAARADRLRRSALGAFVLSALLGILTAIDLDRFLTSGWIQVGRENQLLSGLAAQLVIGAFALGGLGSLVFGLVSLWRLRQLEPSPRNDAGMR